MPRACFVTATDTDVGKTVLSAALLTAMAAAGERVRAHKPVVTGLDVTKVWSTTQALSGATFAIGGGVTGLLGANGAGKTTLLGLILGLHRPDSGTITVFGQDPWLAGAEVRSRLGYAPEHDALPPDVAAHDEHLAAAGVVPEDGVGGPTGAQVEHGGQRGQD